MSFSMRRQELLHLFRQFYGRCFELTVRHAHAHSNVVVEPPPIFSSIILKASVPNEAVYSPYKICERRSKRCQDRQWWI